ncbi:hypothetical protein CN918_27845 [Priestia megaterium]|nr:hypothetical protein CN918_27845 [Priestia megaterium]
MTKQDVNEAIKKLYIMNESLEESDVKKLHKKLYKNAINLYGQWDKVLRGNFITKKKLKERQRFMLYAMLKNRYMQKGADKLKYKEIDPDTKEQIVQYYKTVKALKDIVISKWTEDKVMFEMRIVFMSGATVQNLDTEYPVLYEHILNHYNSLEMALEDYDKRFGMPTISADMSVSKKQTASLELVLPSKPEEQPQHSDEGPVLENGLELEELANIMVRIDYLDNKQDLYSMVEAQKVDVQEIQAYVMPRYVTSKFDNKEFTLKTIYKENPVMHFAIKIHYGDLESAIEAGMRVVTKDISSVS